MKISQSIKIIIWISFIYVNISNFFFKSMMWTVIYECWQNKNNLVETTSVVILVDFYAAKLTTRPFGFSISSRQQGKTMWAPFLIENYWNIGTVLWKFIILNDGTELLSHISRMITQFPSELNGKKLKFIQKYSMWRHVVASIFAMFSDEFSIEIQFNDIFDWFHLIKNLRSYVCSDDSIIFLMRFTPEEWAIVLKMAKKCLNKPNLKFFFFIHSIPQMLPMLKLKCKHIHKSCCFYRKNGGRSSSP